MKRQAQPRLRESRILTEQSESEFAICAVELDQALGGGVLGGEGVVVLGDGRGDLLGQLLSELDAQIISSALRDFAGLEKEVVLVGVLDRVEIWDKAKWDESNAEVEANMDDIAGHMEDRRAHV